MKHVPEPRGAGYTHRRRLTQPMPAVVEKARAALGAEGFGVLTEIDVQATLKKKILGACLPEIASIGVFLPCNVDVSEGDDGATYVETVRPEVPRDV